MKAQLRGVFSMDFHRDLSEFVPENRHDFSLNIRMYLGPLNDRGEESFDLTVCTPDWLKKNLEKDEVLVGRHYLIMLEYNYDNLMKKINELIDEVSGDTWDEVGEKLSRIGFWEFEDYKP